MTRMPDPHESGLPSIHAYSYKRTLSELYVVEGLK
jgi:hypothetical protein